MSSRRIPAIGLDSLRLSVAVLVLTMLLVAGVTGSVTASPSPVSACPPCDEGFVRAAASHGLDTEVEHSEATVRVHENGSATWTVRVAPTNESVLDRLAENRSLARTVAADSFGIRYGSGIEHELVSARVVDERFVVRYRTLDVVRRGALDTRILTYFRDSPGAYVYTGLGADRLTVVAPEGTTVARGFGEVAGSRMTATELPETRDGPFVVFAPRGSAAPRLLGGFAVVAAIGGVIVRNLLLFVALPGGVLVGGIAGIRRYADPSVERDPVRLGSVVAVGGALLLGGTVLSEADAFPSITGNLLVGGFGGTVPLVLGVCVAVAGIRRRFTAGRFVGVGLVAATIVFAISEVSTGVSDFHTLLAVGVGVLPTVVGLGWADARRGHRAESFTRWVVVGIAIVVFGALVAYAPITALGGALFLLTPILLTGVSVGVVVAAVPLFFLGAAGGLERGSDRDLKPGESN